MGLASLTQYILGTPSWQPHKVVEIDNAIGGFVFIQQSILLELEHS